jgi:hypothetical protein
MFGHGAASLAVDAPSEQDSEMLDTPLRGFSFSRGRLDRLVSGEAAEADERAPAVPFTGAAQPEPQRRRRDPAPRLSLGLSVYFICIGLVATTTIVIFFGVAFLLLLQPLGGTFRSAGSLNPVRQFDSAMRALRAPSDGFQGPIVDTTEPVVFRQATVGSNVETASPFIPAVTRPAAPEALSFRTREPAGTDNAAQSSASTLVSERVVAEPAVAEPVPQAESVPQAEAARSGRGLPAVASTPTRSDAASSPEAAPVSLAAPVHSGLSAADIADLLDHGDALLRIGDIASARLFYERAADAGNERAALHLGASFDPDFLGRAGLGKLQADAAQARLWYSRAVDLGVAAEAKRRLDSNGSK